jgi:hypothetical protein
VSSLFIGDENARIPIQEDEPSFALHISRSPISTGFRHVTSFPSDGFGEQPTMSPIGALFGHGAMSELSPLSGVKQTRNGLVQTGQSHGRILCSLNISSNFR